MPNASKYTNYRQELKHLLRARSAVYILVSKQMVKNPSTVYVQVVFTKPEQHSAADSPMLST